MLKLSNSLVVSAVLVAIGAILVARGDGINNPGISSLTGDCSASLGSTSISCNILPTPDPGYLVNGWYLPRGAGVQQNGVAATANSITCGYGAIEKNITIGALGISVTTLSVGGNQQVAIYKNANLRPGLFLAATTSSLSTTLVANLNAPLVPNIAVGPTTANGRDLWFCTNQDNGVSAYSSMAATSPEGPSIIGGTASSHVTPAGGVQGYFCTGANCTGGSSAFGAWPGTLAGSTWGAMTAVLVPRIGFQVTSIP